MRSAFSPIAVGLLSLGLAGCDPRVRAEVSSSPLAEERESSPHIELCSPADGPPVGFDVVGLSAKELAAAAVLDAGELDLLLCAYVDNELAEPPAMAGTVVVHGGVLRFTPRYALEPGLR